MGDVEGAVVGAGVVVGFGVSVGIGLGAGGGGGIIGGGAMIALGGKGSFPFVNRMFECWSIQGLK